MEYVLNVTNTTSECSLVNASTGDAAAANGTIHSPVATQKHILSIFKMIADPIAMLLNFVPLVILLTHKNLQTPFSVYIVVVMFASFLYASIEFLLTILETYGSFTVALCYVQQCAQWLISPQWSNAQLQICLNRIWALTFPISYKERHTKRLAIKIIAANWIVLYIIGIPTIVVNTVYKPATPAKPFVSCTTDMVALGRYSFGDMIITLTIPTIVVVVSYPYLLYQQLKRSKKRKALSAENPGLRALIREDFHAFLVLTTITFSVAVSWVPVTVSFTMLVMGKLRFSPDTMQIFSYGLSLADLVMNPCLLCLAVTDLRKATLQAFCCGWNKKRQNAVLPGKAPGAKVS
ncbi:adenosine receptor A1-like [Paramacrobiotus metropolitanus]|uniref:adenosine receptor A1-like n=1 Tax=Paramacrobiotus metropolitanus TaxID=2943436 RepID=UPI00244638BA|nr:adenosine receptor A1-like [Paramacrobiotus metropolitanus]